MAQDLEWLKQRIPLLEYLQRHNWTGRHASTRQEYVGLCPLHREAHPSFYVNSCKNLFYCHGCGQGGDLIRFVQLFLRLPFRQAVAHLEQELIPATASPLLEQAVNFYQLQLDRHSEAVRYLEGRGLYDPAVIKELGIGYAPGGNLRCHLVGLGYPLDLLLDAGLINSQGRDAFCRRVIFPCTLHHQIVNIYGRSVGAAFPHRFLPHSKGGLFAWDAVQHFSTIILVEGPFDVAVLWQAGFRNSTSAFGTNLTSNHIAQLCDQPGRLVYVAFDQDENQAGQQASRRLSRLLKSAGLAVRVVQLPKGQDPASYFEAGATAVDFTHCLQQARTL